MDERVANEIQHGRFLAHRGAGEIWNWESPAGRLRWARRVKMLSNHLRPGMSVLELGCGAGYFTRELARSEADIVAIDVSPELLKIATANCSAANVRYEIQNAYDLSYPDAAFDSVVGSSVLHHLEIKEALREIYRVLKPGGTIWFTEPNMLGNKFFSVAFTYLLGQTVKDTLCGTKVLWRSDWQRIKPMLGSWGTEDRWGDYELLFGAAKLNLKILDLPVHYQERIHGSTKMTMVFRNGLVMLRMCWHGFLKLKLGY